VDAWVFWAAVTACLVIGEWLTPRSIFLAPAALGAALAAILAAAGVSPFVQVLVFVGGALASYVRARFGLRP
jgi:membrane protein implicated in regulation of membrane protease activity